MDCISSREYGIVVFMKSAQVGATEILNNVVGYYMENEPAPMMVVQPTLDMAKTWSKDRLAPMLRDSPCLRDKVRDKRSRDSENTILHKQFPGGHLTASGANSAASLASRPIRILLGDEIDRYPPSAGSEGDPFELAKARTKTFLNRVIYACSTPTVKGHSRIEDLFEESNQQYYYVPCPHCDEMQRLKWANVKWPEDKPENAYYVCEVHGCAIEHTEKRKMLDGGEWRATAESSAVAGFHISEIYSPWVTWGEMAVAFKEAKKTPETLKTFINTALGETWEEEAEKIDPHFVMERAEDYGVPEKVLCLTAAVDVQDDRLECQITGWGDEFESWLIDHEIMYGDPGCQQLWQKLDKYLQQRIQRDDGMSMGIATTMIDSGGHHTDEVYRFCSQRYARNIYAIKGKSGVREIVSRPTKNNRHRCPVFTVGVDRCKDLVFWRLSLERPGAGYMHYHVNLDDEYFLQLTAEERREKYVQGRKIHYYHQVRRRNEALDLMVYNIAAVELLNPNFDAIQEKQDAPEPQKQKPHPLAGRSVGRGNFATSWKK